MYAVTMPTLYETALAFLRKKRDTTGHGDMKHLLDKIGAKKATFYRAIDETDATARASEFMTWLDVLGVQLILPGEDAYPTTEIDRQAHRKLCREIPDNMIPFTAERAFPGWSEAQRETTLRGVLEGSIPLTVGLYYAIANAVLDDRPGEQLDRTATELMTGIVATADVNETTQKQYPDKPKKKAPPRAKAQPPEVDLSRLAPASGRTQETEAGYEARRVANGGTGPRK